MKETQSCNENSFPWHMVNSEWNAVARDGDYQNWYLYKDSNLYRSASVWYSALAKSDCTYQNTNHYHGADVVLVGCDLISCKHWDKVYVHLSTPSDQVTTVNPVSQTLDDTESWILETVQSAERLLLGTTAVSYWVKFPLADKANSKLTREKEVLIYVSGNTKTKYYCATENVAILAQSLIVLLDDNKAKTIEQTA